MGWAGGGGGVSISTWGFGVGRVEVVESHVLDDFLLLVDVALGHGDVFFRLFFGWVGGWVDGKVENKAV